MTPQELEHLVHEGEYRQMLAAMRKSDDKVRQVIRKWVAARWKERRKALQGARADVRAKEWMGLTVVAAATARTPKEALAVPLPSNSDFLDPVGVEARGVLAEALAEHGRDWVESYLTLAANAKWPLDIDLLAALLAAFELPPPVGASFLPALGNWFGQFQYPIIWPSHTIYPYEVLRLAVSSDDEDKVHAVASSIQTADPVRTMAAIPGLRSLVSALFSVRDGINELGPGHVRAEIGAWVGKTLKALLAEGALDRAALVGDAIAALSRGDSVSAQRLQATILKEAEAGPDLVAHHADTLLGLLASGHGSAAGVAQALLRALDGETGLDDDFFVTACEMVFARKEKGLREEQYEWGLARIKTRPAGRAATLRGLAAALATEEYSLQRKVVAVLQTHWPLLDPDERAPLANHIESRATLPPDLLAALSGTLGAPLAAAPASAPETLMESRPLRPFEPVECTREAMREALAELAGEPTTWAYERFIDGALRLVARDRAALRDAMRAGGQFHWKSVNLLQLFFDAIFGRLDHTRRADNQNGWLATHGHRHLDPKVLKKSHNFRTTRAPITTAVAHMRFNEIAFALLDGKPYPLLSRPSYDNGSITATDLIERMRAAAAEGVEAGTMDLLCALMRTSCPDKAGVAALRGIGSSQANIAADFFAAGGMEQMTTTWLIIEGDPQAARSSQTWLSSGENEVCVALRAMPTLPALDDIPVSWADGFDPEAAPDIWEYDLLDPYLSGVLPNQGEVLAAMHLWGFRKAGKEYGSEGGKAACLALPAFLAARGPAGPALHLAVLFALSANDASARLAGSDGLLDLIAQGRYDGVLAAELAAAAIRCGSIKPGRFAKSLQQVVAAGTGGILWPMVRAGLDAALAGEKPPAGGADLVALACEIVARQGIREDFPTLAQVAARKGSGKLLVEARRLLALLTGAPK